MGYSWLGARVSCPPSLAFLLNYGKLLDYPLQGQEAAKRVFSLSTGSQSVADFSIDFRIVASESGWGEFEFGDVFLVYLKK